MRTLDQIRREARRLKPISASAVTEFAQAFPRLLVLVNEKLDLEARFARLRLSDEDLRLIRDAHTHLGGMVRAVYEFGLFGQMAEEFAWYVATLSSRGLPREYFRTSIESWIIAIHSAIRPPESAELARPLQWLRDNLTDLYAIRPELQGSPGPELEAFMTLILSRKRHEAGDYLLGLLDRGYSIGRIQSEIVTPAMAEVGHRWQRNEISVADEHAATEICRYSILRLIDGIEREQPLPYKALIGCVPGEEHDLGVRLISGYFEAKGWTVYFMGHSTPEDHILKTIESDQPNIGLFSITLLEHLPAARDLFGKIRSSQPDLRIVAGGRAAVLAEHVLTDICDAVVSDPENAHMVSIKLVGGNA
jgi:methanogenic corrinoid protein MtbC1